MPAIINSQQQRIGSLSKNMLFLREFVVQVSYYSGVLSEYVITSESLEKSKSLEWKITDSPFKQHQHECANYFLPWL